MPESSDGKRKMSAIDWHQEIGAIAGPMLPGDTRESWLTRAARRSGATFRQIKALYYGESADPRVSVAIGVLSAADKARAEASELASRFELLAGAMNASTNKDFHSEDVTSLIHAARRLRGMGRT